MPEFYTRLSNLSTPGNAQDLGNQNIASALPIAIYTCNADGYITYYNDAAAELWGRKPEIGKDLFGGSYHIFNPDGSPLQLHDCPMAKTLRTQQAVVGEEIMVERPDGELMNIIPHPKPLFDDHGTLIGAVNMLLNITDQRKTEKKLEENQRYFKMVEEVDNYAILMLSIDGNIVNWNRGAEKIKGYKEHEIIGKNFRIFYREEDQKEGLPDKLIAEAAREGKALHEGWRVRKDGSNFWGNILITALHDSNDNIIGYSKVTRDLTEKKLQDDKLLSYARDIEFRNKQLEEYAYVASHDLQEPLRKIRIFTDYIKNNIDDKTIVTNSLDKIDGAARRMTNLITDVLEYSQLSQSDSLFTKTDLNHVLDNVIGDLDFLITEKDAKINSTSLPTINGIPIQISQLFSNLIGNAIKFSDKMPVIDITLEPVNTGVPGFKLLHNKEYFKIVIKDNGIGFDDQYSSQVFKLFKRVHANTNGTGIGLALCKKIVENHAGFITVESKVSEGTTFTIVLPY